MKTKFITPIFSIILAAALTFTGCGSIDGNATLVNINDGEDSISMGYGNFFAKYSQSEVDAYYQNMGNIWAQEMGSAGTTYQDDFKKNIMDNLEEQYLCRLHAGDYDVTLSENDSKKIEESADKFLSANTEKALSLLGANKEYVTRYLEDYTYLSRVKDAIKAGADVSVSDEEVNQTTFSYVLFSTGDTTDEEGNTTSLTDEEKAEQERMANELVAAEDFAAKATELGKSPIDHTYLSSMNPAEDELGGGVIGLANSMEDGQTAILPVEELGYYVIHMDKKLDAEATATKRSELEQTRKDDYYKEVLDGWKDEIDWKVDDSQWAKITFKNLFTQGEAVEPEVSTETES